MEKKFAQIVVDALSAFREKYLAPIEKRFEPLDAFVKDFTPFDPTELEEKVADVKKSIPTIPEIPEAFDPSQLEEKIDAVENYANDINDFVKAIKPFDDAELKGLIHTVKEDVNNIDIPAPYNDGDIQDLVADVYIKVEELEKAIPTIPEIPKEYDDSELQKSINAVQKVQQEIQEKLARPITVSLGEAKTYNAEAVEKGQVVLHNNNVYVNRIADNDSEPSEMNKSYQCIMKAPNDIVHTGVWDAEKEYKQNEIAMWNNNSYIWVGAKGNVEPNTSDKWKILSKAVKGRKGDKGESGEAVTVDYAELLQKQDDEIAILKAQVKGLLDEARSN